MLVGASGRGKTRSFIKPNIMQMNCNYVISDSKGTLILELGKMLEAHGYRIKVLNLLDMEHSNAYNPFRYIRCDADVYKLIDYLMVNINPLDLSRLDPFWDNAAKALLSAICFFLLSECNAEDQTFANVMKLLRCLKVRKDEEDFKSTLDILFEDLAEKDPEHIAVKQYQIFKSAGNGKTAQSIQISTEVLLQHFNLEEYEMLTSTDTMELDSVGTEKTALFVIVSDTDRSKNWLAGIFYCQLFDILCNYADTQTEDHRLPIHTRFILDDFVCTARIPDFDYKMAMIRSREISCIVVIQDEAQLEKEYWKAAQGIIANCDSYVFLGSSNIDSCNVAAHRLGDPDISGSDIRRMDYGDCVVISGNEGGIFEKFNLKLHPRYSMIADGSLEAVYDLKGKHCLARKPKPVQKTSHGSAVTTKSTMFDSTEEKYLYSILIRISNISVFPHQHLRDLFVTGDTAHSMKLSYMHCEFVLRNSEQKVLLGIEVDGMQHSSDPEQFANDRLKDQFFAGNGLPLLRFEAVTVRNNIKEVIQKVLSVVSEQAAIPHELQGDLESYREWLIGQWKPQEVFKPFPQPESASESAS